MKRTPNPRRNVIPVRFTDEEMVAIRSACTGKVGVWLRNAALLHARKRELKYVADEAPPERLDP